MNRSIKIENNPIVSISELNIVLEYVKDNKKPEIEIVFNKWIKKIDIVFIAGLILYSKNKETKFAISYVGIENERLFEIRQYLGQYENLYNENWTNTFVQFEGIAALNFNSNVASDSFSPILYINKNTINKFFKETDLAHIGGNLNTLREKYINKLQGGNKQEIQYLDSENSLKNLLYKHPPIYAFVFNILYQKISPFVNSKKKGITDSTQRAEELWEFTKEYIRGLFELAKNIVEHSTSGNGMITIRVYENTEPLIVQKSHKVLETHVFDFGEQGIIQKLRLDTKRKKSENKIYLDDLETLKNNYTLSDFIKPNSSKRLYQQLYREIAHYGLMKFYNLIEKNEGAVVSSTIEKKGKLDIYSSNSELNKKSLNKGTSYFFSLPFNHKLFKTSNSKTSTISMQGSAQTVSGLSELINIKIVKSVNREELQETKEKNQKVLLSFKPNKEINSRTDEYDLLSHFVVLKGRSNIDYFSIDMKRLKMSSSSLLRFLSNISTSYPQSIILYNLDYLVYEEMIEDNEQFYLSLEDIESTVPYWYENKGILIYTKLEDIDFNFADLLFGTNKEDFKASNYIVGHTFPNTLTINDKNTIVNEGFIIPECLKPFFHLSSLLPFDLLLDNEDKKTMFQSNLEFLIGQELKNN